MNNKLVIISSIFILGLLFCLTYKSKDVVEGFSTSDCPNIIVKKGKKLHLINTEKKMVPGVNPIVFDNLEEYADYIKWAQGIGIHCPMLYYEQSYDAQNNRGYKLSGDPLNQDMEIAADPYYKKAQDRLLLDANRDDPPYNQNNFAGFDPNDEDVGIKTPLDNITMSTENGSPNPMDANWKGHRFTQEAIDNGEFSGRTRKIID
jgi:hypothetical protein